MKSPLSFGFVGSSVGPSGDIRRRKSIKRLVTLTASGLVYCSLAGFVQPAVAFSNPSDPVISALQDYVQLISAAPASAKAAAPASDDGVLAALRDYAQGIDAAASAEDISSGLRGYVQVAAGKPAKAARVTKAAVAGEAIYVGSAVCMTCHGPGVGATFSQTLMGKIFLKQPRNAQERLGCEGCHGPGSLHVKAGGGRGVGNMISFRTDDPRHTVEEYNAVCMSCHEKGDRTLWRGSTHEQRNVACVNCHTIMQNVTPKFQLAKLTEMDTCFQCHKNKRAEIWRSSHMPIRESKMTCTSCHNPHGSYSEALLKEATINDNCYKCHAEKRGPFLWEHAPVRENCENCHDPHGSNNDFLLRMSRPRLCQQCHFNITGHPSNPRNPVSFFAINRECQNCHSQHHGSNSPAGVRWQR